MAMLQTLQASHPVCHYEPASKFIRAACSIKTCNIHQHGIRAVRSIWAASQHP